MIVIFYHFYRKCYTTDSDTLNCETLKFHNMSVYMVCKQRRVQDCHQRRFGVVLPIGPCSHVVLPIGPCSHFVLPIGPCSHFTSCGSHTTVKAISCKPKDIFTSGAWCQKFQGLLHTISWPTYTVGKTIQVIITHYCSRKIYNYILDLKKTLFRQHNHLLQHFLPPPSPPPPHPPPTPLVTDVS